MELPRQTELRSLDVVREEKAEEDILEGLGYEREKMCVAGSGGARQRRPEGGRQRNKSMEG